MFPALLPTLLLCLVLCAGAWPGDVHAQAAASREAAASIAQQRSGGGRVLAVRREGNTWVVKVVTDGRVREYRIAAQ